MTQGINRVDLYSKNPITMEELKNLGGMATYLGPPMSYVTYVIQHNYVYHINAACHYIVSKIIDPLSCSVIDVQLWNSFCSIMPN